jgi:hydrogenase expression/formation protein HypD
MEITQVTSTKAMQLTRAANALAVLQAKHQGLTNFSVLVSHVTVPAAIKALMESPGINIDGFLAAGHVCTVMGYGNTNLWQRNTGFQSALQDSSLWTSFMGFWIV